MKKKNNATVRYRSGWNRFGVDSSLKNKNFSLLYLERGHPRVKDSLLLTPFAFRCKERGNDQVDTQAVRRTFLQYFRPAGKGQAGDRSTIAHTGNTHLLK